MAQEHFGPLGNLEPGLFPRHIEKAGGVLEFFLSGREGGRSLGL
jgi:hypothetical protein